jgi:hypothetical protein
MGKALKARTSQFALYGAGWPRPVARLTSGLSLLWWIACSLPGVMSEAKGISG